MRIFGVLLLATLLPLTVYAAVININTASARQLETLKGIGPSKASAIIEYREKHGLFTKIEDIQKVSGIGPVTFANIKESITVGDTASRPEAAPQPPPQTQPTPPPAGSHSYKNVTQPAHDTDAVAAPATATAPAAVAGAALAPVPRAEGSTSLFRSPWAWAAIGIVILSAGAFILL